jgi:hypothetical protein
VTLLRAGALSFLSDLSAKLAFDRNKLQEFISTLVGALGTMTDYVVSKMETIGVETTNTELKNFNDLTRANCDQ